MTAPSSARWSEDEITERALVASALNIATDQVDTALKPAVNA